MMFQPNKSFTDFSKNNYLQKASYVTTIQLGVCVPQLVKNWWLTVVRRFTSESHNSQQLLLDLEQNILSPLASNYILQVMTV
jgi:phospholipase C